MLLIIKKPKTVELFRLFWLFLHQKTKSRLDVSRGRRVWLTEQRGAPTQRDDAFWSTYLGVEIRSKVALQSNPKMKLLYTAYYKTLSFYNIYVFI